jgi:hypothetical protein
MGTANEIGSQGRIRTVGAFFCEGNRSGLEGRVSSKGWSRITRPPSSRCARAARAAPVRAKGSRASDAASAISMAFAKVPSQ